MSTRNRSILRRDLTTLFTCLLAATSLAQQPITPGGLGTPVDPYRIRELGELVWMQTHVVAGTNPHYQLQNDIDATDSQNWVGGFRPIGTAASLFRGTFHGGGFAIRNLTIVRPTDTGVGLFRSIGTNGVVRDLRIENANILGRTQVGILAGLNLGTVSNCVVTGRVQGQSAVGGIVGDNITVPTGASPDTGGRLIQTSASVEATGIHYVGGLAGINNGTIADSFSTGLIESPSVGSGTGGLVGGNLHGAIQRSSSSSITRGNERVGGLVGFYSGNTNGLIRECFSVGPVTGRPGSTGGLIGLASPKARTESSYWDFESSGQPTSSAGIGLDSVQMRNPTNFIGWAVGSGWTEGPTGTLLRHAWAPPLVRLDILSQGPGTAQLLADSPNHPHGSTAPIKAAAAPGAEFLGWRGVSIAQPTALETEVDIDIDQRVFAVFRSVHEIWTPADLRRIGREPGYALSDRYRLMTDLDFIAEPTLEPIGPDGTNSFTGVFEGNGHSLRNVRIGATNLSTSALFGWVGASAEIIHLHLVEAQVLGRAKVGGLVALNLGRIADCTVTGHISGQDDVGGIAGINHGVIEDCISRGTVVGSDHVGGIAGFQTQGRITRSVFNGTVEGTSGSHAVGGICGWTDSGIVEGVTEGGSVSGSHFVGGAIGVLDGAALTQFQGTNTAISGRFSTGGIAGFLRNAGVTDSTFVGSVHASESVGGAFGQSRLSSAFRVHTAGRVEGDTRVGGWAGSLEGGLISESHSDASVLGRLQIGGGVGRSTGTVTDSHTDGPVQGEASVGGLVGENWRGSITNSRSTSTVHGIDSVGGLVGLNLGSINASTASGSVAGELLAGGLVGLNRNGEIGRSSASGDVQAPWTAGGLVGENFRGQISEAAANGQVSGDHRTGGLVGGNFGGTVSGSVSSGLLLGGNRVGGLVGENTVGGVIERSASSATVYGISEVGGLVGYNGDSTEIPRITESLASGHVMGNGARIGGLVGFNEPGFIMDGPGGIRGVVERSYHAAGQGSVDSPPAGSGVSRTQLRQQATFASWDFTSDWTLSEGTSTPRPAWQDPALNLRVVVQGPGSVTVTPLKATYAAGDTVTLTATPDTGPHRIRGWIGIENTPSGPQSVAVTLDASRTVLVEFERHHTIRTVDELARIGRDPAFGLGDHYVLTHDIDAAGTGTWNDPDTSEAILEGFPPIGSESNPFTGTLDGQGHTLHRLRINRSTEESVGLFAVTGRGARIHNLRFTEASVAGSRSVGVVVGNNWGATLARNRIQGEVTGERMVGLVSGLHQAAIAQTSAAGTVTLDATANPAWIGGGIAGQADHAVVRDTHFNGNVSGPMGAETLGGIVGEATQALFQNVTSSGTVEGAIMVGGIAGRTEESLLNSAWSTTAVSAGPNSQYNGGLIGFASQSIVAQSGFAGSVLANQWIGGLVGQAFGLRMQDSFFAGTIGITNVSVGVGGLIGEGFDIDIANSHVNGSINGHSSLGGISGAGIDSFSASSVYWNQDAVGAGVPLDSQARSAEALRNPDTFVGWNLASIWAIDPLRNHGFPFLRQLPYAGLGVSVDALVGGSAPLLGWIAAHQSSWDEPDLAAIPSNDLLAAYLLDQEPVTGLHQQLQLELQTPTVEPDQLLLDADLTLGGTPVEGTLQGRWIIESATDPNGPWHRLDWTDQTPPLVAGRTRFDLPGISGNLFRVRIEPGLLP